jgi:membrane protease YdiL (CAAX protease family)
VSAARGRVWPTGEPVARSSVSPLWMAAPAFLIVANFVAAQFVSGPKIENAVYDSGLIAASLLQDAVFIGYVAVAAWVSRAPVRETLALRPTPLRPALRLALPLLAAMIVLDLALEPLTHAGQQQGIAPDHTPQTAAQWQLLVLAFVAFALVAPLAEELLFRGLGFAALGRYALPLTSALFAFAHAIPVLLVPVFLGGLALGYVRSRTGSLWPGLGMHVTLNGLGLAVALLTA